MWTEHFVAYGMLIYIYKVCKLWNFGFWVQATSNIGSCPVFQQTMQFPSPQGEYIYDSRSLSSRVEQGISGALDVSLWHLTA
jgi:hypothetical protein